MPTPRRFILQGPAHVLKDGLTTYTKDNILVKLNVKTQGVMSESIGQIDLRDDDIDAEISYTPDGQVTSDFLAQRYPYFTPGWGPGMSIFPDVDSPLVIWARDGNKYSFNNTAKTKQPDFFASAIKTIYGSETYRALRSDNTPASSPNSLVHITKEAYPGDDTYDRDNIITSPFSPRWLTGVVPTGTATATEASPAVFSRATHGLVAGDRIYNSGYTNPALNGFFTVHTVPDSGSYTLYLLGTTTPLNNTVASDSGTGTRANPFDKFSTESGFVVSSALKTVEVLDDEGGVIDIRLDNDWLTTQAKCILNGPAPEDIIAALGVQDPNARRGRSRNSLGRDLYLNGSGIYFKMTNAFMTDSEVIRAGAKVKRIGNTTFMSTPSVVGGVLQPPALISTEAID